MSERSEARVPSDKTAIRVGLIGYGYVGRTFHAPLIRAVPGLTLTTVGSSQPERVLADVPSVEVLADPYAVAAHPEVDLVVIASPNESHQPLATAALQAGKHVVVDKPFTLDLAGARSLAVLAEKQGKLLSVFQNRRWDSDFLGAAAVVNSGVLGNVVHYESHIDRYRPEVRKRWREQPGPGSGLWFDLGPHLVDQALCLFGVPDSLQANIATLRPDGETNDWAHVQLNYPGRRVLLHCSMLSAGGVPRMLIHGTLASWVKAGSDVQEKQLIAGMRPGDAGWGFDPDPGILFNGASGERTPIAVPPGDQVQYYLQIRGALLGYAANPVPPDQAIGVMAILEYAVASASLGKTMTVELTEKERTAWR